MVVLEDFFHNCLKETFLPIIAALRKRDSFSDEEIFYLQKNIDKWYHACMPLTGLAGITNYIHMLGSGHTTYYLKITFTGTLTNLGKY